MLELITAAGNIPVHDTDGNYAITHKYNGVDTLHFEISVHDPVFPQLAEEAYIHETTENQTYVIKGIDAGASSADIDCELNLEAWRGSVRTYYYNDTSSLPVTMQGILPTGWSMQYQTMDSQRRSVLLDAGGTPLDIALTAQDSYGCAMRFDTAARVCTVHYPQTNATSDTVLIEGVGMRTRPNRTGKSTDLVTRIYPIGADGLTIESVNDGKAYVENHTYTNKVICQVWKDERYEVAENLRDDAQAMVDQLAVPEISWEIDLLDLYRSDPTKWGEHKVSLYQRVRVVYGGKTITALVVEEEVHPYHPENNTICVNSVPGNTIGTISGLVDAIKNPNSSFNSEWKAAVENATKLIAGSRGGRVVTVLDDDGKPMELCILSDSEDITTARSLWRWNEGGLGHSDNGYNGPFTLALTKDGAIVADRITVGKLNAGIVKAGILTDGKGANTWNMETGEFALSASSTVGGNTVDSIASSAVSGYDSTLDQQKIFNRLTNNGQTQGIYLNNGLLYINGTYLKTGIITDGKGANQWNLNTGEFSLSASSTIGGSTVNSIANSAASSALSNANSYTDGQITSANQYAANAAQSAVSEYDNTLNQQKVFNKLTNNGQTQGIYLSDGRLYINGSYIKTGVLDAGSITMSGKLFTKNGSSNTGSGYLGYMEGLAASGTTRGVGISNQAADCYLITTEAGVRVQAGNYSAHITKTGNIGITANGAQLSIQSGDVPGLFITGPLYQRNSSSDNWRQI